MLKPIKGEQEAIALILKLHVAGESRSHMAAALRAKGFSLSTTTIHRIIHGARGKAARARKGG